MIGGRGLFTCVLQELYSITRGTLGTEPKSIAHRVVSKLEETSSIVYYNTEQNLQYTWTITKIHTKPHPGSMLQFVKLKEHR